MFYDKWMADRVFLLIPAQAIVGEFLKTFAEFPPRAKSASFSIDQAMEKLMPGILVAHRSRKPMALKQK